jgi:hypothetical protein
MEEVIKLTDHFVFTTSTAEVTLPDDFNVEFLADFHDPIDQKIIKIKNLDELMDFIETIENE